MKKATSTTTSSSRPRGLLDIFKKKKAPVRLTMLAFLKGDALSQLYKVFGPATSYRPGSVSWSFKRKGTFFVTSASHAEDFFIVSTSDGMDSKSWDEVSNFIKWLNTQLGNCLKWVPGTGGFHPRSG